MMFSKIGRFFRDQAYNFVSKEGGFILHFFSDFIRGHSKADAPSSKKSKQQETPLNYEERKVFEELLERKQGESQVDYWKRKKVMLNLPDKKNLVTQELDARKLKAQESKRDQVKQDVQEKRQKEMQLKRMEMAKYLAIQRKQ